MSCVGLTTGEPSAAESRFRVESISSFASRCAAVDSGTWTAIWSPSKSALNAKQTSGWIWMAEPSTRTGMKAWMPEPMEGGRPVQQNRMVGDDLLQHVPHLGANALHDALGALDVVGEALLDELPHDERLEQLERHLLRQAALMQLELGADHDDRPSGVVDALAEQVLAEPALLALQHVRQALEPMVPGPCDRAAAAAVVDQGVARLLQHPLLVADDDLGRLEVEEPRQAVVAVDDPAIEVVQVGGREATAVELHHRSQVGRNDGQRGEDHPLRSRAALAECLDQAQPLDRLLAALARRLAHLHVERLRQLVEVDLLDDLLDRLGAHPGVEHAPVHLGEVPELALGEDLHDLDVGQPAALGARPQPCVIGLLSHLLPLRRGGLVDPRGQVCDGGVVLLLGRCKRVGSVLLHRRDLALDEGADLGKGVLGGVVGTADHLAGGGEDDVLGELLARFLDGGLDRLAGGDQLLGAGLLLTGEALLLGGVGRLDLGTLVGDSRLELRLLLIDHGLGGGDSLLGLLVDALGGLLALRLVDTGDDVQGEVEDALQVARADVEQDPEAARRPLEVPDVADRAGQLDVAHALAADLRSRDLDATLVADDALVADALVLAAVALPVLRGTEDALVEEAVLLRLERAVVDRLRLGDLAGRPALDLLRRRQADPDRVEIVDFQHERLGLLRRYAAIALSAEVDQTPAQDGPMGGHARRRPRRRGVRAIPQSPGD